MRLTSPAFQHQQLIPAKYTCQGEDVSPPLHLEGIPKEARCLALIMDDPDAPRGTWIHWVMWNLPPVQWMEEGWTPHGVGHGNNSWERTGYGGPCPPSGTHRYFFKLYALDELLDLPDGATKEELEHAMRGHVLSQTELIGLYKKN